MYIVSKENKYSNFKFKGEVVLLGCGILYSCLLLGFLLSASYDKRFYPITLTHSAVETLKNTNRTKGKVTVSKSLLLGFPLFLVMVTAGGFTQWPH